MNKSGSSFFRWINTQSIFLLLLASVLFGLWLHLEQALEEGGYPIFSVAFLWVLTQVFGLWLGNLIIYRLIQRYYSWESAFNLRFFFQLLLVVLYSLIYINATYLLFKNYYTEFPPSQNQFILLNIYGMLFLIPVLSIQFGLLFLQKWKRAIVEQEKLKQEQARSELITLRSHLSPHFLFNNLNILSSLIEVENHAAQEYLDRFAEVYRYVLKNRDVELIALREEMQFLDSYNYLLHQRFSNGLQIDIQVEDHYREYFVPPLALQMLLENALKHNKLSEEQALEVKVFASEGPVLIIQNNLQPRAVPEHEKTGMGLENIRRRYLLSTHQNIDITQSESIFRVTLPLIKRNRNGHTNH